MSSSELERESMHQLVADTVLGDDFRRATFAGAVRGPLACPWARVILRPVDLRGQRHVQFAYFDAKKNIIKNFALRDSASALAEVLGAGFAGIHLATSSEEIDIRTTKKGKVLIGRRAADAAGPAPLEPHNRVKDLPLPEGRADWLLEAMGILTRDGHVRPALRAKFTQVNEFLKQLIHALDEAGLASLGRAVEILDCGCGSSFLTLAVHHYLNDVVGVPARIIGVDVNEEMIRKSVERSQRATAEHLSFSCSSIGAGGVKPDMVLALHACDTATDDAIAQAIVAEAQVLLCVPCCHHDLNSKLRGEGQAHVLRPLLRHGILQQRTADLVTDAFRALVLRIMGYRTDVVEFISPEHTARNLMIRAVRGLQQGEVGFVNEYVEMCRFWGVTPYIEEVLGEPFQRLVAALAKE
jgi:SAM-dependent methyltransferase